MSVSFEQPVPDVEAAAYTTDAVQSDGLVVVKLSDKTTVKLKELNGMETLGADRLNGAEVATLAATRALASIRQINARPYGPALSQSDIASRAALLTGREYDKLTAEYVKRFVADEQDSELLKNE